MKVHNINTFDLDNRELCSILLNKFTSTALVNVVRSFQRRDNGVGGLNTILANVEGGNYTSKLKKTRK